MMLELREYVDELGRSRYSQWLDALDDTTASVLRALGRLEQGNLSHIKSVGAGVSELRIDFCPGFRVYIGKDGERLVLLLGGGTKRKQQEDIERAKASWQAMLRDYINGTIGFSKLAADMNRSPKSLMRMLGPDGNPQAKNLFDMVAVLQNNEGVHLELRSIKSAAD